MRRPPALQDLALFASTHLGETADAGAVTEPTAFDVVMDAFVRADERRVQREACTAVWEVVSTRAPTDPGLSVDVDRFVQAAVTFLQHQYPQPADAARDRRALSHLFRAHVLEAGHAPAPSADEHGKVTRTFKCACGYEADGDEEELYRVLRAHIDRAHPEHHRPVALMVEERTPDEDREGPTIAVVEDEPAALEMLCDVLGAFGYTVMPLRHPRDAEAMDGAHAPHLFLVDLMLPDTSGIELADHLRAGAFRDTPMIAMSASSLMLRTASASGLFDDTVQKPFDVTRLLGAVGHLVN